MRDLFGLAIVLSSILCFALGIVALAMFLNSNNCEAKGTVMGLPHQWGVFTDCMIKVEGHWIPLNSYKVIR